MYLVALTHQSLESTPHGDHIIIGMGAKDDHPFGIGFGPLGAVGIICLGLTTGPSGNGMLQIIENLDIDIIG